VSETPSEASADDVVRLPSQEMLAVSFCIAAPSSPSTWESDDRSDSSSSAAWSRQRVLWIDDQIEIGDSALRVLTLGGFRVECARTGSEGLRKAASAPYAGIILDLRLPDMPGLAVLQRLRTAGIRTPVLVVTGFAEFESAVAAIKLGAADYKSKPLIGDDLIHAVGTLISGDSREIALGGDNPDHARMRLVPGLDEIARRLATSTVGVFEFVLVARSFRHLVGGSNTGRQAEMARTEETTGDTALAADLLEHIVRAISSGTLPSCDQIAREVCTPAGQVSGILKALTGSGFRDCRRILRLRPAIPEIAWSHEQIAQIAYQHGYQWPGQLDRDFKATLLLTPNAFRRLFVTRDRSRDSALAGHEVTLNRAASLPLTKSTGAPGS
jgi:DNA-binding response OmpR family regulator